jgi:hypothetical protein
MGDLVNDFDFTRTPLISGAMASAVQGVASPGTSRTAGPAGLVTAASTVFATGVAGAIGRRRRRADS